MKAFVVCIAKNKFKACTIRKGHAHEEPTLKTLIVDQDGDTKIFNTWLDAQRICNEYEEGMEGVGNWVAACWNNVFGDHGWDVLEWKNDRGQSMGDREDFHSDI